LQLNSIRPSHSHVRWWDGEWTNISKTIPYNRNREGSENIGLFSIWLLDMAASWMKFTEYMVHFIYYCMQFKPSFWQNIELKVQCSNCGVDTPEVINYCRVLYITNKSATMPKTKTEQSLTHVSHSCITTVATLSVCSYSLCS